MQPFIFVFVLETSAESYSSRVFKEITEPFKKMYVCCRSGFGAYKRHRISPALSFYSSLKLICE